MALKKRKKVGASVGGDEDSIGQKARKKRRAAARGDDHAPEADGDVSSGESSGAEAGPAGGAAADDNDEEDFFESPDEKRVRLAKEYLRDIGKPNEQVNAALSQQVEEREGRARSRITDLKLEQPRFLKGHKLPITCVCLSSDEKTVFSGGKDCAVLRWDLETGKKDVFPGTQRHFECGGHFAPVMDVCFHEAARLVVSVGNDRLVRLWDPRAPPQACVDKLWGHTGDVTSVVVEPDTNRIYTGSADKSVKIWDLGQRRCVDTLLGHVGGVTSMDINSKGRPLTGSTDKTARLWKVDKDTHLMFNKHQYSVDAVAALDSERFVSGSQDGSLMAWTMTSKKPVASQVVGENCWITALGALRRCNHVFSGSSDGILRAWSCGRTSDKKDKEPLGFSLATNSITLPGCINGLAVGRNLVVAAVAKEHKFGRWFSDKAVKSGIHIMRLSYREL